LARLILWSTLLAFEWILSMNLDEGLDKVVAILEEEIVFKFSAGSANGFFLYGKLEVLL
jgi:hypothetical protein